MAAYGNNPEMYRNVVAAVDCVPTRDSGLNYITDRARVAAERASVLRKIVHERLDPVLLPEGPEIAKLSVPPSRGVAAGMVVVRDAINDTIESIEAVIRILDRLDV